MPKNMIVTSPGTPGLRVPLSEWEKGDEGLKTNRQAVLGHVCRFAATGVALQNPLGPIVHKRLSDGRVLAAKSWMK
jgi:hypothetical protein